MLEIIIDNYIDFKNEVTAKGLKHFSYANRGLLVLVAIDGPIAYKHILSTENEQDYSETLQLTCNKKVGDAVQVDAFASKLGHSFRGRGLKKTCPAGVETSISFVIPDGETYDMDGIEVLNGAYGDQIQMKVVDNEGVYSGQVGYVLDQFGIDWNAKPEVIKKLPYNATVLQKMKVELLYKNNGAEAREVYVNLDLHKVVT